MKRKLLVVGLIVVFFSLGLLGCKSKSTGSSSNPVPENEGVAFLIDWIDNRFSSSYDIKEVSDVTNHYKGQGADQVYCIGFDWSKTDSYNYAIVYKIDGDWEMSDIYSGDGTCAENFH